MMESVALAAPTSTPLSGAALQRTSFSPNSFATRVAVEEAMVL